MKIIFGVILCVIALITESDASYSDVDFVPTLLKLFDKSVVIKGEITNPVNKTVSVFEEYHDASRNISVVRFDGPNSQMLRLDLNQNQLAVINQNACQFYNLTTIPDVSVDYDKDSRTIGLPARLHKLLKVAPKRGETIDYRGVSCVNVSLTLDTTTYFFLISKNAYSPNGQTYNIDNFPLQISRVLSNTVDQVIDISFVNTDPNMLDYLKKLQIPTGTCNNLPSPIHPLPKQVSSYVLEARTDTFYYEKRFFDLSAGLTRVTNESGHDLITDSGFGYKYIVKDGDCTIEKATEVKYDYGYWRDNFFRNGALMHLVGQEFVRGILCNVYEGQMKRPEDLAHFGLNTSVTVRYSYSAGDSTLEGSNTALRNQFPVQVTFTNETVQLFYTYNFYDFYQKDRTDYEFLENFDISACIPNKAYSQILFRSQTAFPVEEAEEIKEEHIRNIIVDALSETTGYVRTNRFTKLTVEILDETSLLATVLILDNTPVLYSFYLSSEMFSVPTSMKDMTASANTDACAEECMSSDCNVFLLCPGKCYSSLNLNSSTWGVNKDNPVCQVFKKIVPDDKGATIVSLKNIQEKIQNATLEQKLKFDFDTKNKVIEMIAAEYQPNLEPFDPKSKGSPFTLTVQETMYRDNVVENQIVVGDRMTSIGACYRACRDNDTFGCVGFSFCNNVARGTVTCIISTELITDSNLEANKDLVVSDLPACNIFALNFLKMFNKDEGKVKVEKTSDAIESVISAEDCAIKCRSNEGDLFCRGFDYCAESKVCMLFDQHHDHGKESISNDSLVCEHYALRFKSDYDLIGKARIVDPNAVVAEDLSEADCAKECSEYSVGCNAYSYCTDGGKCARTKLAVSELTSSKIEKNKECDLYIRNALVDEIINPKKGDIYSTDSGSGVKAGGLAGIIIMMFVIGIAIGMAINMYYPRIRAYLRPSPSTGTTVAYTGNNVEF